MGTIWVQYGYVWSSQFFSFLLRLLRCWPVQMYLAVCLVQRMLQWPRKWTVTQKEDACLLDVTEIA